jgi:hypothetical protein
LAFLKRDKKYVFEELYEGYDWDKFNKKFFGDGFNGLLVVNDVEEEFKLNKIYEEIPIQIFEASMLEDKIEKLLKKSIELSNSSIYCVFHPKTEELISF